MPETHVSEEDLILHYYGEATSSPGVAEHVAQCAHCSRVLQELTDVLALVDAQPAPEPLAGLERRVWDRLRPAVERPRRSWWARVWQDTPRWAVASALAVIVASAFVAGRLSQPTPLAPESMNEPDTDARAQAAAETPALDDRLMTVAVGEHLDQSQMVLLELLNSDVQQAGITLEQERARDLVAANRLFRQLASRGGNEGVREVLDALERVLIEIANAPPDVSARELEALRADIEQRGILFRVRVVAGEMRAREGSDQLAPPAP